MQCRICNNTNGQTYIAHEMMFGFRDSFTYWQCDSCECLQLVTPPDDISRYYPRNYYAFVNRTTPTSRPKAGTLRCWFWRNRNKAQLFRRGFLIWRLLAWLRPRPDVFLPHQMERIPNLTFSSRVLDVGCGNGNLLLKMYEIGFDNLLGIDPYVDRKSEVLCDGTTVRFLPVELHDLDEDPFDLIMFHHSLEHMPDQHLIFRAIEKLLAPTGTCLIRIPTVSSTVWEKYKSDWVELDAPRHFYLHSHKSISFLANSHGLQVTNIFCDSDAFAYLGSELYQKQLTLVDPTTRDRRRFENYFSEDQRRYFETCAKRDNQALKGGRIVLYLRKSTETGESAFQTIYGPKIDVFLKGTDTSNGLC